MFPLRMQLGLGFALLTLCGMFAPVSAEDVAKGAFLNWRGANQNGHVDVPYPLPGEWEPDGKHHLWSIDLPGRGTPVVGEYPDGPRMFAWGYEGQGAEVFEVVMCIDPATGEQHWKRTFADFISDIIYNRYSIGAPTIDAETGNVYLMTSPGLLVCLDYKTGKTLWQHSMMEAFGRLTFPNGRTGAVAIDGDLVIVNAITTSWGAQGPARNRFYAFDKQTGEPVWASDPGVGPPFLKDSSFCTPFFETRNGTRVFYAGLGDGNVVCVNATTGQPLWRYQLAIGGINSSMISHNDILVAIHGKENVGDTGRGRMIGIDLNKAMQAVEAATKAGKLPAVLTDEHVLWKNDELSQFTSSPTLLPAYGEKGAVAQLTLTGLLASVDIATGKTLWSKHLAASTLHASPLWAGSRLYVPMWQDGLYILTVLKTGVEVLDHIELEGEQCIGSPSLWKGRVYLHTTKKLHCFGTPSDEAAEGVATYRPADKDAPYALRVLPNDVLLRPGESQPLRVQHVSSRSGGRQEHPAPATRGFVWTKQPVVPNAPIFMDAEIDRKAGTLVAGKSKKYSAGGFEAQAYGVTGTMRGRTMPAIPFTEDFEAIPLRLKKLSGSMYNHPPGPWISARLKWEVVDHDGSKVLRKTLDRVLFQRSQVFIGEQNDSNYTISADVMSGGNRRLMSAIGVINQRYIIMIAANRQVLEILSNHDRVKVNTRFRAKPNTWYRIKSRVDVNPDGSGVIRAKAWPRGEEEPAEWMLEAKHAHAHTEGSPGIYGFSPQSQFPVYIDNIEVTPND